MASIRPLKLCLTLIVGFAGALPVGSGRADEALKQELEARYADLKAAMAAHDSAAVAAIFAPDFKSVDVTGKSSGAGELIASVNSAKSDPNRTSETTLLSVEPAGMGLTVEQQYDMKTVKTDNGGARYNVELVTLSTDTWIKADGQWLLLQTVTKDMQLFKDGQMVLHKNSAPSQ
jgi:ketosteroid isomerase-like protein